MVKIAVWKETTFAQDRDFYNAEIWIDAEEIKTLITKNGRFEKGFRTYYAVVHLQYSNTTIKVYKTLKGAMKYAEKLASDYGYPRLF